MLLHNGLAATRDPMVAIEAKAVEPRHKNRANKVQYKWPRDEAKWHAPPIDFGWVINHEFRVFL